MLVEMAVKSMETVVEATASMEMAPGALPHPGRVSEQRLLSLEIGLQQWRRCGTILGKTLIVFGFSVRRLYIGGEAASEVDQGNHTIGPCGPRVGRATLGCGCPLAPLWLSFGLRPAFGKNRSFGLHFVQF
jgi:hypothetical protein